MKKKSLNSKAFNIGGNPKLDREESLERFEIIKPFLEQLGYKRFNQRDCIFFNEEKKNILVVTSAPSQTKMTNYYKSKLKSLKKELNSEYNCYIYFSRNYSDWSNKAVYVKTLQRIQRGSGVSGIFVGMKNLSEIVNTLKNANGEILYIIK